MPDNFDFKAIVELNAQDNASTAIQKLQRAISEATSEAGALEKALSSLSSTETRAASGVGKIANQTQVYNQYLYDQGRALGYVQTQLEKYRQATARAAKEQQRAGSARVAQNLSYIPGNTSSSARVGSSFGTILDEEDRKLQQASRSYSNLSTEIDASIEARRRESQAFSQSLRAQLEDEAQRQRGTSSIISQRYALYDLATTYSAISAGLLATSGAAIKVGADFESAFTGVQRTLDPAYRGVQGLREELVNLSTQIPLTFQDISQIAQLGNQLGIAGDAVEGFTKTVAEFSTVSGISVDETAQAFGRLQNLLGISDQQFENLGSSIALVGVNSAATESQIIAVARELAPFGRSAGFTADQIIALSGALASLGVQPERARSAFQQFSTTLTNSVAQGGDALQNFATITGLTAEQLNNLVRSGEGGQEIFTRFLQTLSTADPVQLTQALDELGLSNLRVDATVRALTQNIPVYAQAIDDASEGFASGAELARQYGLIVDDLSSQWQIFINTINATIDTLSGGSIGEIAQLLGGVSDALNGFRQFTEDNEWVQTLAQASIIIGGLVGALAALQAAQYLATASTYALITAQAGLSASGGRSGVLGLLAALVPGLATYSTTAEGATIATYSLRGALASLARTTVVLALIGAIVEVLFNLQGTLQFLRPILVGFADAFSGAFGFIGNYAQAIANFDRTLANSIPIFSDFFNGLAKVISIFATASGMVTGARVGAGVDSLIAGLNSATSATASDAQAAYLANAQNEQFAGTLGDVGSAAGGAAKQVRTLVDYANDLAQVFSRSFDIRFASQLNMDEVSDSWEELAERIHQAQQEIAGLTADRSLKEFQLSVAEAFGNSLRADQLRSDIADLNDQIADAQADASTELDGNSKAARNNRKALTDLLTGYEDYIQSLAESGADQATLNAAVAQSRQAFIDQATALGFSSAQLTPYIAHFNDLTTAINRVPKNITVSANTDPAIQALNELMARVNNSRGSVGVGIDQASLNAATNQILRTFSNITYQADAHNLFGTGTRVIINGKSYGVFASGGYTGHGGKYEEAGIVHRGEYVVPKRGVDQSTGLPKPEYVSQLARSGTKPSNGGYASGGFVNSNGIIASLSPQDRALLRGLGGTGDIVLTVDSREIARASNSGNKQLAAEGTI